MNPKPPVAVYATAHKNTTLLIIIMLPDKLVS